MCSARIQSLNVGGGNVTATNHRRIDTGFQALACAAREGFAPPALLAEQEGMHAAPEAPWIRAVTPEPRSVWLNMYPPPRRRLGSRLRRMDCPAF